MNQVYGAAASLQIGLWLLILVRSLRHFLPEAGYIEEID